MNSPFATIFLALQARITDQVPDIIYIDMDYGQLEAKERPAVSFPCVLIDFPSWAFSDLGNLVQEGTGSITLKLATDPYSSTSNITPEEYKEAGLNILDLEWSLFKALQGWKPGVGTKMIRSNYSSDNRRPGLKVRQLGFTHSFQDSSAKRTQPMVDKPSPTITDESV